MPDVGHFIKRAASLLILASVLLVLKQNFRKFLVSEISILG